MRRILSSMLVLALGAAVLPSCKKGDVIQDPNSLGRGSYVTLVKQNNNLIDFANLAGSTVSIEVKEFGKAQEKITVYVSVGTPTRDKSKWKKIKEVPNANNGTYAIAVTGTEIATAIAPTAVAPGTQYTLYNSITTTEGQVFDFANTSPTLAGNSNYNAALTWAAIAVCPFTGLGTDISFEVLRDDWADWSPGDVVKVSDGPSANTVDLSKVWPNPAYGTPASPFIINVTQASGSSTTAAGVTIARYPAPWTTRSGATGFIFSCTGLIDLRLPMDYNGSLYGTMGLTLQRK